MAGWLLDYLERDPEEAKDAFQQAAARNANDLEAPIGIGEALMRQGRIVEAKQYFQQAVSKANQRGKLTATELQALGWCLLRLGRYQDAIRALGEAASMDETLIEADLDLSLALLCFGKADAALDEYKAAVLRTRTIPHPGRRRSLVRLAIRDLDAVFSLTHEPPGLIEVYKVLASVPTGTVDSDNISEEGAVKLLYIPLYYKCRTHSHDLTNEVQTNVEADGIPTPSFGYRRSGKKQRQAFRVKVRCPEEGGHDLTFRGTYGPE
jgi:tetratricopeptide (TPR) repeat protein